MTDFNAYDPTAASDLASQWQDASQSLWSAYDASMGYTSTDTSFIEPATSASSMSMISDNSAESSL